MDTIINTIASYIIAPVMYRSVDVIVKNSTSHTLNNCGVFLKEGVEKLPLPKKIKSLEECKGEYLNSADRTGTGVVGILQFDVKGIRHLFVQFLFRNAGNQLLFRNFFGAQTSYDKLSLSRSLFNKWRLPHGKSSSVKKYAYEDAPLEIEAKIVANNPKKADFLAVFKLKAEMSDGPSATYRVELTCNCPKCVTMKLGLRQIPKQTDESK